MRMRSKREGGKHDISSQLALFLKKENRLTVRLPLCTKTQKLYGNSIFIICLLPPSLSLSVSGTQQIRYAETNKHSSLTRGKMS